MDGLRNAATSAAAREIQFTAGEELRGDPAFNRLGASGSPVDTDEAVDSHQFQGGKRTAILIDLRLSTEPRSGPFGDVSSMINRNRAPDQVGYEVLVLTKPGQEVPRGDPVRFASDIAAQLAGILGGDDEILSVFEVRLGTLRPATDNELPEVTLSDGLSGSAFPSRRNICLGSNSAADGSLREGTKPVSHRTNSHGNRPVGHLGIETLSPRERTILGLIGAGRSNKQIAWSLRIAPETVKSHIKNLFLKLRVERRAQAVARCHELFDTGYPGTEAPEDGSRLLM